MNIYELADVLDVTLEVKRFSNQGERWMAEFESCEIKDNEQSSILKGLYGDGHDPIEAINDYVTNIKGKLLVFNAGRDSRKEFMCPDYLKGICCD